HYNGKTVLGYPGRLYRNLGNWKFEDVTARVGLDVAFQYSHGAAAFDFDCDGWTDLLITGYNRLVLLHNEPDGKGGRRFVDVTKKAGLNDALWSTCAAWGDRDARPDIYVANDTTDNFLFRNRSQRGELIFDDVGLASGVARDDQGKENGSMGVDAADYDRSGKASLIVSNYEGELPALYLNR